MYKTLLRNLAILFMMSFAIQAEAQLELCASPVIDGDMVEIQVTTNNFNDIVAYQFGIAWELSKFEFESTGNFHESLLGLSENAFSYVLDDVPEQISLIRTVWFEPASVPVNINDGEILFSIYLRAKDVNDIPNTFGIVPHNEFEIEIINSVNGGIEVIDVVINGPDCGVLSFESLSTGVEDLYVEIAVGPNPVDELLNLRLKDNIDGQVQIYNILGELLIFEQLSNGLEHQLDLSTLVSGTYLVRYDAGSNGQSGVKKIFKR